MPRLFHAACLAAAVLLAAGCGRSTGLRRVAVNGAILFHDQPLKAGRITFTPIEGSRGPMAAATVTDGFYEFTSRTGPVAGPNKVQIESLVDPGFALDDEIAYAAAAKKQPGRPILPPQPVPAEYNQRSTLAVTVTPGGESKFDFRLE